MELIVVVNLKCYYFIRATFGQNVGPFRKQVGNGVEYYFEGMCPKSNVSAVASASTATNSCPSPTPNTNTIEVPGSPILKAQLCAPPKATTRKDSIPKQASYYSLFLLFCLQVIQLMVFG